MLTTIGLTVVALFAAVLIFAATKPDAFRIARTVNIKAPPEKIFALIEDFNHWGAWSPYEKLDPAMKRSRSGAAKGKGAIYAWESDGKAGTGRMEIVDSAPASRVTISLEFLKPFKAHNVAEFTLVPEGAATQVTWAMQGPQPYIAKVMTTFFSMDAMVGKDFEAGLSNLKATAEA